MSTEKLLEIPELLILIGTFMSPSSLVASSCVSKFWHHTLQHLVWHKVPICPWNRRSPDVNDVLKYEAHVESLQISDKWPNDSASRIAILKTISQLTHIKDLSIHRVFLEEVDAMKLLWDMCERAETLEFIGVKFITVGDLTTRTFPRVRALKLSCCGDKLPFDWIDFLRRCPNLETIVWPDHLQSGRAVNEFLEKAANGTCWPALESIWKCRFQVSEDTLLPILTAMPRVTGWAAGAFGPRSYQILSNNLAILKRLDLGHCQGGTTASILQEIMSSCPQLEILRWGRIDGNDMIRGRPWVCTGLRELGITIMFDREEIDQLQPLVFERLSQLTALEYLDFSGKPTEEEWAEEYMEAGGECTPTRGNLDLLYEQSCFIPFRKSVDLRLGKGLEKLATLRRLKKLHFEHIVQHMGDDEVEWILKHWKWLTYL
ncbi:hypothetical protein BGZ99_005344 [Dissophora globulifera]|uniref:F-box protein n=1 Tax=Dissophora globulifera TaxID=979702 RepID=A0A9P6RFD1_9FUNG|nr:hypothetical protein BGZ99_005344 [Dissophora globulifera]